MDIPLSPPSSLHTLTPKLKKAVQLRVRNNLSSIITRLSASVFYRESSALESFRHALCIAAVASTSSFTESNTDTHLEAFYSSVPLTSYDAYSTYVSKFLQADNCLISDVRDLLSPGLPIFIAHSSGTSGAAPKHFLKYPDPQYEIQPWDCSDASKKTICRFNSLRVNRVIDIADADGNIVDSFPVSTVSSCRRRSQLAIGAKDDDKLLNQRAKFWTTPFAVSLLPSYHSNIYMTLFFTIMDSALDLMSAPYSTFLYDAIRVLEENWEAMVHAIEHGYLPPQPDLGDYRTYLETFVTPNPERAAELRKIEVGAEGWLKKIWPSLNVVTVILSGQYGRLLPKLRDHFGPSVSLQCPRHGSTECRVGVGYGVDDTNLFCLNYHGHLELLDIEKQRAPQNLSQPWEVVTGKKYEIVATTTDGLWRYMLGDIVEAAGFSPTDGQLLYRYCGRNGVNFCIAGEFVSESLLQQIMASLSDTLGSVLEFTTEVDDRKLVRAYGFFVELEGKTGPAHLALAQVQDSLLLHEGYRKFYDMGRIADPTIRVVAPGTFQAYRAWKIQTTGCAAGQVKVPTTIVDLATMEWLAKRVVYEVQVLGNDG
ncbi:hypothetical protein GALMADRAFT_221985 [Galerina marginata CBS 339.88]|uniref:GH3 auxin-responsive promoter n=1 Tax=Galerina marginata (strain CBS 339.88) TaxID=685588 RepID=A0A067TFW2_GALM3|nr:hypothetical protein GALMADRAFT_221985 [Galerina marginata CBS 339.88]